MMISFNKIVLRDQIKSDIDDEIRWMTEETGWIKADTPWESVIQIDPEQLKKQMMRTLKTQLASYKRPKILEFVRELPKTSSGKIRRAAIKERDYKEHEE